MANQWTKTSDYISYDEAVAQAALYAEGLLSAEKSLMTLEGMGVKKSDPGYIQTVREIKFKRQLLEIAEFKVKRSYERLTKSDKKTNKKHKPHKGVTKRTKRKTKRKVTRR